MPIGVYPRCKGWTNSTSFKLGHGVGREVPEDIRRKISQSKMGHPVSKETREKLSKASADYLLKHPEFRMRLALPYLINALRTQFSDYWCETYRGSEDIISQADVSTLSDLVGLSSLFPINRLNAIREPRGCFKKGYLKAHPEVLQKISENSKKQWRNPERMKLHLQLMKKLWDKPEFQKTFLASRMKYSVRCETDAEFMRAKSEDMKNHWRSSEYVKKQMRSRGVKPNKKELKLLGLLNAVLPSEFRYVGDGQVVIDGLCPDFVNCNGKKQIIELFGNYWHRGELGTERIARFAKYGYLTLIVWESELSNLKTLSQKISQFAISEEPLGKRGRVLTRSSGSGGSKQ